MMGGDFVDAVLQEGGDMPCRLRGPIKPYTMMSMTFDFLEAPPTGEALGRVCLKVCGIHSGGHGIQVFDIRTFGRRPETTMLLSQIYRDSVT